MIDDADIETIIACGLTRQGVVDEFKNLPPEQSFPLLIEVAREGNEAAVGLVRNVCVSLCNAAPPDDLIWIAERLNELGKIVRGRGK